MPYGFHRLIRFFLNWHLYTFPTDLGLFGAHHLHESDEIWNTLRALPEVPGEILPRTQFAMALTYS